MKKKFITSIFISVLVSSSLCACGSSSQKSTKANEQEIEAVAEVETEKELATEEAETDKTAEEANTCYEAGRACLYGLDGQEIDREAAYNNFQQALEIGKTEANFYLGVLYDEYNYPEHDYAKVKAYYEAAGDNPFAQLSLVFLYYTGRGMEKDAAKAQELFDSVIADGCVEGYYGTAAIAEDEKDYATALEYYNKAAEGQEELYTSDAMECIGYMYYEGKGVVFCLESILV